ncbi:MAG TPA: endolytic transglycosylase MltG [Burkholderiales bacterium]|nr:endolytic transglycosylase MltG [Burkholderiales bacterium]
MIKRILTLGGVVLVLMAVSLYWYAHTPLNLVQTPIVFDLKPGSSLPAITRQMQAARVLQAGAPFRLLARISGKGDKIRAGFYVLNQPLTPLQLLDKLTSEEAHARAILFVEGWTFSQMRVVLNAYPWITHDTENMTDQEILQALGVPIKHAEGWFFPSTYYIDAGSSDLSILRRAYATMQQNLQQAWAKRDPGLPYASPVEALIMASIIEKETAVPDERPHIAAVFINRLRLGMRLQTDPTVIYGLGSRYDGNLHKRDLQTDTPYNTYTRAGLPPTPIAMPGEQSILAAMHPAHSNDLYFVSKGDGTHFFSSKLSDHNRAVARFQKNL